MSDQKTYKENVLDHYRNPRNFGEIEKPDIYAHEDNPLCGDECTLYLALDDNKVVTNARFKGRGCAISLASASLMTEAVIGKSLDEVRNFDEQRVLQNLGIEISAMRLKCANLVLSVLRQGVRLYDAGRASAPDDAFVERRKFIRRRYGLVDHIGNTPLIRLSAEAWGLGPDVRLFVKNEGVNPGGSIKARPVLWAIRNAIKSNQAPLLPSMTILDAAHGASALAIATIGAAMGFATRLVMPAAVPMYTRRILKAYGAQVMVLVDETETIEHAIEVARATYRKAPESYCLLDLRDNPAAWKAHYETTAPEIITQLGGDITHFVAGIGSGATLAGVARRLREQDAKIHIVGVTSLDGEAIEGLRGASSMPKNLDGIELAQRYAISRAEAEEHTRMLARHEGLLCGPSSGAAVAASLRLAREIEIGTIVTVLSDRGERHVGDGYWTTY